jgi:hypothetical protein
MMRVNYQCDGSGPHSDNAEVRKYPLVGDANLILCLACVGRENRYRAERRADKANPVDPAAFPHQAWADLEVYE